MANEEWRMEETLSPAPENYPDWKAPADDSQMLIWPDPAQILSDTIENHRRLSSASAVRVQNVALPEVRSRQRAWIGHADHAQPLIANGHQAELHHAGVWVKNVLIGLAAAKLGGDAIHFAVDTDEPKHLVLRWPSAAEPLTDDPHQSTAAWSGLVDPPTPRHLNEVRAALADSAKSWSFTPIIDPFFDALRRLSLDTPTLPAALVNAIHELEWGLGLRHQATIVSPLWECEPYSLFVHHMLARADELATNYNAALGEFRAANSIKSPGRPMPDLRTSADFCESPFWLDTLSRGGRSRAYVERDIDGTWSLRLPDADDRFPLEKSKEGWQAASELREFLRRHDRRLAPRAIMLTTFMRLLVADQFVHGIGGGRYDQVTDRLIARQFGIAPPRFAVTTATMYFPDAVGRPRTCLPCIAQQGHRLKHAVLGDAKRRMLEEIAALPRRSAARREAFAQMHRARAEALRTDPEVRRWEQEWSAAEDRARAEQSIFDRELFFALQPRDRLEQMIARYREFFA